MSEEVSGVSRCYLNVVAPQGLNAGQMILEGKNVVLYFKPVRCQRWHKRTHSEAILMHFFTSLFIAQAVMTGTDCMLSAQ